MLPLVCSFPQNFLPLRNVSEVFISILEEVRDNLQLVTAMSLGKATGRLSLVVALLFPPLNLTVHKSRMSAFFQQPQFSPLR